MIPSDKSSYENLILSASFGAVRAALVSTVTHPIETVKCLIQSNPEPTKVTKVVYDIIRTEGLAGFYKRGYLANLSGVTIKQIWRWPLIMGLPPSLEKRNFSPLTGQLITGTTIATADAFGTAPFDKLKTIFIVNRDNGLCNHWSWNIIRSGWKGIPSYWMKLSVNWNSCLISQRLYRDRYKKLVKRDKLTIIELMFIGLFVGLTVSAVSAPIDYINTHVQGLNKKFTDLTPRLQNLNRREFLNSLKNVKIFYRGFNAQTAILMIHNISTVILIEWLSPLFYKKEASPAQN